MNDSLVRLRRLFTQGFLAIDLASPLLSFDAERDADNVARWMEATSTEVVGVRIGGLVSGYVERKDLGRGNCREAMRPFGPGDVLRETAGLQDAIEVLDRAPYCFLSTLGTVDAVVVRSDVQKPQGRMWLFGMITIIEMAVMEAIQARFPEDAWKEHVSAGRLRKAEHLRRERARRHRRAGLLDCLQLSDKARILVRDPEARRAMAFESNRTANEAIKRLESLRNSLAHSQDVVTNDWPAIALLAGRLERVLHNTARGFAG